MCVHAYNGNHHLPPFFTYIVTMKLTAVVMEHFFVVTKYSET